MRSAMKCLRWILLGLAPCLAFVLPTGLPNGSRPYLTNSSVENLTELAILSPVPFTGGWVGGWTMRIGAEIAKDIINSQQKILPGYYLSIRWMDDTCNNDNGVQKMLEAWVNSTKWVALGSNGCSAVCMATAIVVSKLRFPQLSYGCASGSISDTTKYPDISRMMVMENTMADVFNALGQKWNWTAMHIITGDPSRFDAPAQYLMDWFKNRPIQTTWLTPRNPSWTDILALMNVVKASQQRVLVVLGYEPFYRKVICAAYKVGIPKGVVWLSVGWHKSGWWNDYDAAMMAPTGFAPDCTIQIIGEYYEGGIGGAAYGKPAVQDMNNPLTCYDGNYTPTQFWSMLTHHFTAGYPVGENILPGAPYSSIAGNAPDGMCVWAYLFRHMIFKLGYTVADMQRPNATVYREMIRFIKEDILFNGVSGIVNFTGNDKPGILAVNQVQKDSQGNLVRILVATVDLQGTLAEVAGTSYRWGDGATAPGSVFKACPPGSSLNAAGQCINCAIGTYHDCSVTNASNGQCTGTKSCVSCPQAYANPNTGGVDLQACSICGTGRYSDVLAASACKNCTIGRFSGTFGLTQCGLCVPGEFADQSGTSACKRCPTGTYSAVKNATICDSCDSGKVTLGVGARSAAECVCDKDTYKEFSSNPNISTCKGCPEKMTCALGSTEDALKALINTGQVPLDAAGAPMKYPEVEKGFWTPKDNYFSVYRCTSEERCPGGPAESCALRLEKQACAQCMDGFYWTGETCASCSDPQKSKFLFPVLPGMGAFLIVVVMYKLGGDVYEFWNSWKNQCICIGFLTLNHQQILSIINNVNLELHINVKQYFGFWSFTENILSIFKLACTGYGDFTSNMIMKTLGPIYLFGVTCAAVFLSRMIANCTRMPILRMSVDRASNMFLSLILTFFIGIASLSLSLFKCIKSPNGVYTMKQDPSVDCYKGTWNSLLGVGIGAVWVYCICCGGVFTWAVFTAPRKFAHRRFQMRWKFLFIKFRPETPYWALVIMARGLVTNIGFVFFTFGLAQLYWIMSCEVVYMCLTIYCSPWRFRGCNFLSIIASISIILACALNAVWIERSTDNLADVSMLVITLTSFPVALAGTMVLYIMYSRRVWSDWSGERTDANCARRNFTAVHSAAKSLAKMDTQLALELYMASTHWDQYYLRVFGDLINPVFFAQPKAFRVVAHPTILDIYERSGRITTIDKLAIREDAVALTRGMTGDSHPQKYKEDENEHEVITHCQGTQTKEEEENTNVEGNDGSILNHWWPVPLESTLPRMIGSPRGGQWRLPAVPVTTPRQVRTPMTTPRQSSGTTPRNALSAMTPRSGQGSRRTPRCY